MSTSIDSIYISRCSFNNYYRSLNLTVVANRDRLFYNCSSESGLSETEAASDITERFVKHHKFEHMKVKILSYFEEIRSMDHIEDSVLILQIPVDPIPLEPHS